MNWFKKLLDAADPSVSMRSLAFGLVSVSSIFWLTWDMIRGPITSEWNVAFGLLLTAVTTSKVMNSEVK
jgi:hypothetical protein